MFRGIDTRIDVTGSTDQIWNGSYPVICAIVEGNEAAHTIMSLGGQYSLLLQIPLVHIYILDMTPKQNNGFG